MVALVVFVCVVSIPCLIWFVIQVKNAPEGYEDKDGYHNAK
jgi:hypothetical protein